MNYTAENDAVCQNGAWKSQKQPTKMKFQKKSKKKMNEWMNEQMKYGT